MTPLLRNDEFFMNEALREADKAFAEGDVPVGALVVHEGQIIGKAHNQRELLKDPTAHAEMIALTQAAAALDNWRLTGCTMFVTLEPCAMCAGALVLARVDRLVYAAPDPKAGACGSVMDVVRHPALNHKIEVTVGVGSRESAELLQEFFQRKRKASKKTKEEIED